MDSCLVLPDGDLERSRSIVQGRGPGRFIDGPGQLVPDACGGQVSCKTTDRLWHKGSNQSLFKTSDLHITHLCIYAVGPHLIHKNLLCTVAMRVTLNDKYFDCWKTLTSKMIATSVLASTIQHDEYPESGRLMCRVKELSHLLRPLYYEDKLLLRNNLKSFQ